MSHSFKQAGSGNAGGLAHAVQYLAGSDDRRFEDPCRGGVATVVPDPVRNLDDVGHAVVARDVPDFWKPFEEWTLD